MQQHYNRGFFLLHSVLILIVLLGILAPAPLKAADSDCLALVANFPLDGPCGTVAASHPELISCAPAACNEAIDRDIHEALMACGSMNCTRPIDEEAKAMHIACGSLGCARPDEDGNDRGTTQQSAEGQRVDCGSVGCARPGDVG